MSEFLSLLISLFFILALGGLTFWIGILCTGKIFVDRRLRQKAFTKNGKKILVLIGVFLLTSALQMLFNEFQSDKKIEIERVRLDSINKADRFRLDSINYADKARADSINTSSKNHFDTTIKSTVFYFGQAIGKYGLRFDSTDKMLKKIESKKNISKDPILQLCLDGAVQFSGVKSGMDLFSIKLCSMEAGSTNFNVNIFTSVGDSAMLTPRSKFYVTKLGNEPIAENKFRAPGIFLAGYKHYNALFVWVVGSYQNIDKTKDYKIDEVAIYYFSTKQTLGVNAEYIDRIVPFFRNNNNQYGAN